MPTKVRTCNPGLELVIDLGQSASSTMDLFPSGLRILFILPVYLHLQPTFDIQDSMTWRERGTYYAVNIVCID